MSDACPIRNDCPMKGKTILVIEDDPSCAQMLRSILGQPCHECDLKMEHAVSIKDAIYILRERKKDIHCIILDLGLPDSFGLDTFISLSQEFSQPIIIYTGSEDPNVWRDAVRAGASDFIIKGHNSAARIFTSVRAVLSNKNRSVEISQLNDRVVILQEMNADIGGRLALMSALSKKTNDAILWITCVAAVGVVLAIYFS